ncbi:hypothetical protein BSL78_03612 [Apostichopus japonicus]|uniref:Uncharacterized protein n=1 Tax=Stichopus japonicus TaxID=307972 RepID=A0A2G8LGT9_STIJA|nr:hypothetical protein BSL78_03612 [Apostichopus japonicus]
MDAVSRRQEARRRRLQQDPEERLRRIRNLKEGVSEPTTKREVNVSEPLSLSTTKEENSVLKEETIKRESDHNEPLEVDSQYGKSDPDKADPTHSETSRPPQTTAPSTSKMDPSNFIFSFLINQFITPNSGGSTTSSTLNRTIFMCLVAVLFRLLLEIDWITTFTGQSMVVMFLVANVSWLFFYEKVNIQNPRTVILLVFNILQDFVLHLFTFVATHGLLSVVFG